MTCGACVQRVESALRRVPGVTDAVVNLMTESASVKASDEATTSDLVTAVQGAGYDAEAVSAARSDSDQDDAGRREQVRRQRQAMIQAIGLSIPILLLDHFGAMLHGGHAAAGLGRHVILLALTIMLAISPAGGPILAGGFRSLWHRAPNMDLLISIGVLAAIGASAFGTFVQRPEFLHFHAAAIIVTLVTIGRYLETRARGRALSALSALARRAPRTVRLRRDGQIVETSVADVQAGDTIQLVPHSTIPTDGVLSLGRLSVDESLMTGEPMPLTKEPGDEIRAGTIVVEGTAEYRATQVGRASALGQIAALVQRAQATRTRMQRLADRIAAVFTPIVIVASVATLCGWLWVGGSTAAAMSAAIAVVVVACPCALGLATPTAVAVATGRAALRGILVRDAAALETMGQINTAIWDKTGTLTVGKPQVVSIRRTQSDAAMDENELLRLAASAEQFSMHPLARAIVSEARRRGVSLVEPGEFESVVGGGVRATVEGRPVAVGRLQFIRSTGFDVADDVAHLVAAEEAAARTVVLIAVERDVAAVLGLNDPARPSARKAIERLMGMGIRSVILTGDSVRTAKAIAEQLGIDHENVHAEMSPGAKADFVARYGGRSNGPVAGPAAMIGDGVNDAPALAAAAVGIAFATGADVAVAASDISLVGSTPHLVADAVELARSSVRIIRENLFWAFFYNILMVPLAATGWLPPGIAAGAMMLSSLTVVLNALRVRLPSR